MDNQLIKISINEKNQQVVSARDLYEFLEIKERFSRFMERNFEYGFIENIDYTPYQTVHPSNRQEIEDFAMTLDCAKEIAMIQRTDKGKQARQYFIECEKQLKEQTAIKLPTFLETAKALVQSLEENERLKEKVLLDKPKVDFADRVASSSDLIDIGTFAKLVYDEIGLGRNRLFELLRSNGILMKNNNPYQTYIDNGTFKVIEGTVKTPYGTKITTKTLLTGEGQIKLLERLRKL